MALEDWQQRVVTERAELSTKIEALRAFILSEDYLALDRAGRALLQNQLNTMLPYLQALDARIATFPLA